MSMYSARASSESDRKTSIGYRAHITSLDAELRYLKGLAESLSVDRRSTLDQLLGYEGREEVQAKYFEIVAKQDAVEQALARVSKEQLARAHVRLNSLDDLRNASPSTQDLNSQESITWTSGTLGRLRSFLPIAVGTNVLGASITYTTIFSAARGSIDLVAWSWSCFMISLIMGGLAQLTIEGLQGDTMKRDQYKRARQIVIGMSAALVATPMVVGLLLLMISVAKLSGDEVVQHPSVVKASGFAALGVTGYVMIVTLLVVGITSSLGLVSSPRGEYSESDTQPKSGWSM